MTKATTQTRKCSWNRIQAVNNATFMSLYNNYQHTKYHTKSVAAIGLDRSLFFSLLEHNHNIKAEDGNK